MDQDRYVLMDRDGVINYDSDQYIKSPAEWHPLPGSLEAIALLNAKGFKIVVITNQSGLARGLFDQTMLERIHAKMNRMASEKGAEIEAIYYCPHGPDNHCNCRKPKPGLLKKFAADKGIDITNVSFVGDTLGDILAAQAAGAKPILVKTGKGQKTLEQNPHLNIPIFENLYDAANYLISRP